MISGNACLTRVSLSHVGIPLEWVECLQELHSDLADT